MSENEKKVPKRRFKEFQNADEWEQRKLIEMLVQPITDGPHETPDLVDKGIAFISVDAIVDNKIDFSRKRGFITEKYNEECCKKYRPEIYDVYLVKSGSTVGKTAIVETNQQFNIWSPLAAMRCGLKSDPYFLYFLLQTNTLQNQVFDKCSHGTQPNLSMRQLEKFDVIIPDVVEQKRIGKLFKDVDNLITLHQHKLDKLKSLKKAYLTDMFPAEGESKPKLRFAGFTDDWEEHKLSDICEKFTDGDWIEAKDQSNEGVRLIQTGNVGITRYLDKSSNKKWISNDTFDRLNCEEIFPGDIIISRLPDPAGRACIMPDIGYRMITAVDCTIVRVNGNVDNRYLVQYLTTNKYFKEVNMRLAGGTRQRISRSSLAEFMIPMPKTSSEQKKIGFLFEILDDLITLHQRKLEKLQNIKKAYLNEMFI